ncbi:MAG: minichromosome maintenance protein MCM [Promethearchaeota archaeon]
MTTEMETEERRFEEFIRTFKDENGKPIYWSRVQEMSVDGETSLVIDFEDLISFDNEFTADATEDPESFLKNAHNALVTILKIEDPKYVEAIGHDALQVRIINYTDTVPLRYIRARHIGKLIRIKGIMMRASEVKPLLVSATFKCRICGDETPQEQEEGRYTEPPFCNTCGKKTPMKLLLAKGKSRFIDWQKVRIQESPEELPPGQMPRSVDAVLKGDIVDISRPGDMVNVTGMLQTAPDFSRRGGKLATFRVFIDASGVEVAEKEYELDISPEDREEILKLSENPYVHEKIYRSIAPAIQGHDDIKESISLLLFGGVEKTFEEEGIRLRGRSNILLVGDPGTGKSQILKYVADLGSRALYTSGKGTTAAGLTAAVVHDTDSGAMTLEAGALVLADKGIACIDEFDKMDPNDRTAIHEAMEQHTVSIAKAGIVATLNARTSILAAANPSLGRYNISWTPQENIKLPFTILSRFDLIWVMIDTPEEERDKDLAGFILDLHQGKSRKVKDEKAPIPKKLLKKYIAFAHREFEPKLTPAAAEAIQDFYVGLRKKAQEEDAPIPITARQLESLVRLAEARARMALKREVSREDGLAAVDLMKASMEKVFYDIDTGEFDADRIYAEEPSGRRNIRIAIIDTLRVMMDEGVSSEVELLQRLEIKGIPRDKAEDVIKRLEQAGDVYRPKGEGTIRLSRSSGT